ELPQAARQIAVALARRAPRPRRSRAGRKHQREERQLQRIRFRGGEEPLEVPATEHPSPGRRVAREIEERLVAAQRRPERGETGATYSRAARRSDGTPWGVRWLSRRNSRNRWNRSATRLCTGVAVTSRARAPTTSFASAR